MKQLIFILFLFSIPVFLVSCSHPDCKGLDYAYIAFEGFDSMDRELIVVKTYAAGSKFSMLKAEKEYRQVQAIGEHLVDSIELVIEMPKTGRVYKISDIQSTHAKASFVCGFLNSCGSESKQCYNVIASYNLNGSVINTGDQPIEGWNKATYITIRK